MHQYGQPASHIDLLCARHAQPCQWRKAEAARISAPASATTAGSPKTSMWVVVDQPEMADKDLRKGEAVQPIPSDIPAHVQAVIATITESMPFTEPFVALRRRAA